MWDDVADSFHRNGCAVIRGFSSRDQCEEMIARILKLVGEWDGKSSSVFKTDHCQLTAQGQDDYFFESADKVHFFWEDKSDKMLGGSSEETMNKINKIGHGLHISDSVFRDYSFSDRIKSLVKALGWKRPVLPQSMYILKNPLVGGQVTSHQDSSFLYTEPRPTCLGLWLALHDADLGNGCLWYRPASHLEPVRRHFKLQVSGDGERSTSFENLVPEEQLNDLEGRSLEGVDNVHEFLRERSYVHVPCKAGDLVLIHGQVDHLSLSNTSDKKRHSFQLHLVEGPEEGITWSSSNWLQSKTTFPAL